MKIIELRADNFKKLKAISIKPDKNTIILSGPNGAGKTSVLDAIWAALGGKIPEKPIRDGENLAEIVLELDDKEGMVIKRKFTAAGRTYLSVENKAGTVFRSPQTMLNKLIGKFAFDPLEFTNLKEKEQRDTLLSLLNIDLDSIETQKKEIYDERTAVNRDAKKLEGVVANLEQNLAGKKIQEPVIVSDLMQELEEIEQKNKDIKEKVRYVESQKINKQRILKQIEKWMEQINAAKKEIEKIDTDINELAELPPLTPTEQIKVQIAQAEEINSIYKKNMELKSKKTELAGLKLLSAQQTAIIEKLDREKTKQLNNSKLPIKGLGINETSITYNNIPFSQLSFSEKLKISVAISMEMNPELRIIHIQDGSLLDTNNIEVITALAKSKDYQIWIEKVDESGKIGIYIEDGEITNGVNI